MGKYGLFSDLCRGIDCMEKEMCGLCRLFRRDKHHGSCCEKPLKPPYLPPDFHPPCGREKCCCEKK